MVDGDGSQTPTRQRHTPVQWLLPGRANGRDSRGFFASGRGVAGERSGTALIAALGGKESSAL